MRPLFLLISVGVMASCGHRGSGEVSATRTESGTSASRPDVEALLNPDDVLVGGDLIQAIHAVMEFRRSPKHRPLNEKELDPKQCVFGANRHAKPVGSGAFAVAVTPKRLPGPDDPPPYVRGFVYLVRKSDLIVTSYYEME